MTIPTFNTPPDFRSTYIIDQHEGEALSIPGTKTLVRIMASSKQTDGALAVFLFNGVMGDPAGFHYHKEAYDYFLVTKGKLKLWAGDNCRILEAGDFAYVPPMVGPVTETVGLVHPGDWIDFFRYISDPFDGLIGPERQTPEHFKTLMSRIMTAEDKYDVHFVGPDYQPPAVGDWDGSENVLPDTSQPYYLKSNTGPRWLAGGVLSRPFVTTVQSDGKIAITTIESSSYYKNAIFQKRYHTFTTVHHCILLQEGTLGLRLKGHESWSKIQSGEAVVLPAREAFSLDFSSKYVRFICCSSGGGLEQLIRTAGHPFDGLLLPDEPKQVDENSWGSVCTELGILCQDS